MIGTSLVLFLRRSAFNFVYFENIALYQVWRQDNLWPCFVQIVDVDRVSHKPWWLRSNKFYFAESVLWLKWVRSFSGCGEFVLLGLRAPYIAIAEIILGLVQSDVQLTRVRASDIPILVLSFLLVNRLRSPNTRLATSYILSVQIVTGHSTLVTEVFGSSVDGVSLN